MPSLVKTLAGPLIIAVIITVVTFVKVIKTYGEFWQDAFDAPLAFVLLVALNVVIGGGIILALLAAVKPRNKLIYAVVAALSILSLIATPIAYSTFTGEEVSGQPESVKLSDLYNPLDGIISDELDKPVKAAKRSEIAALVARYETKGKAGKKLLLDRLDESLASESVPSDDQKVVKTAIATTLDDRTVPYTQRLRQVAQTLFNGSHRDIVKDLAAK